MTSTPTEQTGYTGVPGYEHDQWGNQCCGHDFMAGTICTAPRDHDGPHVALCQRCHGDWYAGTCRCPEPDTATEEPSR